MLSANINFDPMHSVLWQVFVIIIKSTNNEAYCSTCMPIVGIDYEAIRSGDSAVLRFWA